MLNAPPNNLSVSTRLLSLVSDFGSASERFFDRLYRGLRRKEADQPTDPNPPPDSDQFASLLKANRELQGQVRDGRQVSARLRAALALISEGVILQDQEGRIVLINDAAYKLLGGIKSFWESELSRLFERARTTPEQTGTQTPSEIQKIDDPVRVQINGRILAAQLASVREDGSLLGALIVLKDATRETIADRLRDEFVTAISHELRTPLTAIKGMSEILLDAPDDRPANRKFLEAISRNAATLDRMIIELLDLSEMGAGVLELRKAPLYLDELILDMIRLEEPRIEKAGLNVSTMIVNRDRLNIRADARRLRWAIGHLIDNAIQYTLAGGTIMVKVGQIRNVSIGNANELVPRLLIEVTDDGVGISERDMPRIFDRFYRGEAQAKDGKRIDPRGLGQGLFIARTVAEAHGGYLIAASTVGQGSRFTFAIPLD